MLRNSERSLGEVARRGKLESLIGVVLRRNSRPIITNVLSRWRVGVLGVWEGAVRRARRSLGEGRRRMGKVGGVERSPQIPCMVHFRPRMGAKTGAGHRSIPFMAIPRPVSVRSWTYANSSMTIAPIAPKYSMACWRTGTRSSSVSTFVVTPRLRRAH